MKRVVALLVALLIAVPAMAMDLRPLGGKITGTQTYTITPGAAFGGCIVTSDGNSASVTVTSDGKTLMEFSTTGSGMFNAPISCSGEITCTVSGTNAYAQFFEWVK
jgi:hypothetical protein